MKTASLKMAMRKQVGESGSHRLGNSASEVFLELVQTFGLSAFLQVSRNLAVQV